MDKKDIILIGAGSGIAPYLPLLDEIIRFDMGKKNRYNFNSATLIFMAREGEQISWISNYIFHIVSSDFINSFLKIKIFITLQKNSETAPSFLFWRSILQIYNRNLDIKINTEEAKEVSVLQDIPEEDSKAEVDKENDSSHHREKERLQNSQYDESPVDIKFGRPNFWELFRNISKKGEDHYDVFAWVPEVLSNHLHYVLHSTTRESRVTFKLTLESFT